LYRITENYIKCLHKKEEECKRLEADFMKSHTIPIIKDGEYIRLHEKEAREELERIKIYVPASEDIRQCVAFALDAVTREVRSGKDAHM